MTRGAGDGATKLAPAMIAIATLLAGCPRPGGMTDASSDGSVSQQWTCPPEWVAHARGGCGPAVLLCAADGGAASGACNGIDLTTPRPVADPSGEDGSTFALANDGAIRGGWHEAGEPGGPPTRDFSPLATRMCPAGWTRAADGVCDPSIRTDCPAGSAALPGAMCTATAESDCPSTPYADVTSEAGSATIVRVLAGASVTGADGSEAHPFATIAAGIAAAGPGGWVLVGDGTYAEGFDLNGRVHVVGRCAARVTVTNARTLFLATGTAADVDVRNVTLTNGIPGSGSRNGGHLSLRHVAIRAPRVAAVLADGRGSIVDLDDVLVENPVTASAGPETDGLAAQNNGRINARHVAVSGVPTYGMKADHAKLQVEDSVVRDNPTPLPMSFASAIRSFGAIVTVRGSVVERHRGHGIVASDAGSMDVQDSVVRDGRGLSDTIFGTALNAQSGGTLVARGMLVDHCTGGVYASQTDSSATLSESVIRNTIAPPVQGEGDSRPAMVWLGAHLSLDHVRVESSERNGLLAAGDGTTLDAVDTVVVDTHGSSYFAYSYSAMIYEGAVATISRTLLDTFGTYAIAVTDRGSTVLRDVVIRQDRARAPAGDTGIVAARGGSIDAARVAIHDVRGNGAFAANTDSSLMLVDAWIDDVAGAADSGAHGNCVIAFDWGHVTLRRVLGEHCTQSGITSMTSGVVTAEDLILRDIEPSAWGYGVGAMVFGESTLQLTRVAIERSHAAGIASASFEAATFPTSHGNVTGSDLFVRDIARGTISVTRSGGTVSPAGTPVAYGLHTARDCRATLARVVSVGSEFGFFNGDGNLTVNDGLFTGASDHAGAIASQISMMSLNNVARVRNADDSILMRADLPQAASLEAPSSACTTAGCL